jgi:hypothetical protein
VHCTGALFCTLFFLTKLTEKNGINKINKLKNMQTYMENGNKEHKKRQKHEICRQRDIPRIDV